MVSIEDSSGNISFWVDKLNQYPDWNLLSKEARKRLLKDLQRCVDALLYLHVSESEILNLIQLTDVSTVLQACISMLALPDLERKDKYQALAYLKRIVLNSEIAKLREPPVWHSEPHQRGRKGNIADLAYAKRHRPFNVKGRKSCTVCGSALRIDNITGVCTKCQEKGRNGSKSEH
jgi:hypothetical protein